ncbi:hypothetical protein [Oceanibacterium hippocampi]|uniref:Uncharacterized protein n=1 Tax=Oceanibacterium hippocampi TaxID=745714 RepID=A0A1Y5U088_9PROT|nr:hypothetical protein [Oceanibacterium hippocampi]SLN77633.1 hypothetical protein OCH7691_04488 [Oceanibacterium hippocampi]
MNIPDLDATTAARALARLVPGAAFGLSRAPGGPLVLDWQGPGAAPALAAIQGAALAERRATAATAAGAFAAGIRGIWVTDGKELVYEQKRREAEAWQAAVAAAVVPDLADHPFMAGRAARLGRTGDEVAAEWLGRTAFLAAIGPLIEGLYEEAVDRIAAAADIQAVEAILAALAGVAAQARTIDTTAEAAAQVGAFAAIAAAVVWP